MNALEKLHSVWTPPIISAGEQPPSVWQEERGPYLLEMEFAISKLGSEAQGLFNEFLGSPAFERSVKAIKQFLTEYPKGENTEKFRGRVAGFIFECLAFNFLKRTISSNEVILSPEEVFELYHFIFPEKPLISHPYEFHLGIEGITMPDGVLLKEDQNQTFITKIFEYSLSAKSTVEKQRQRRHYSNTEWVIKDFFPFGKPFLLEFLGEHIRSMYPHLLPKLSVNPEDLKIIFIFPTNENVQKQTRDIPKGQVILLPFSSGEFGGILDGIFRDIGNFKAQP